MTAMTARAAFLERRTKFLGGTDVAAIVGLSPWASPLSVYMDKVGEGVAQEETLAMRRGLALERFIAREFVRKFPQYVVDQHPPEIVRNDWGFPAGASLDGVVRKRRQQEIVAVFESKTTSAWNAKAFDEAATDLPDNYFVQCNWYMAVRELEKAYLAVDVGDPKDIRIIELGRDEKVIAYLIDQARRFWCEHVEQHIPPQPNGSARDGDIIKTLYPRASSGLGLVLDSDAEEILSDFLAHSVKSKEHAELADAAKQKLQLAIGEAETAVCGGWRINYKNVTTTRIDSKALKTAEPDVWQRFAKTSTYRKFEPKELSA